MIMIDNDLNYRFKEPFGKGILKKKNKNCFNDNIIY